MILERVDYEQTVSTISIKCISFWALTTFCDKQQQTTNHVTQLTIFPIYTCRTRTSEYMKDHIFEMRRKTFVKVKPKRKRFQV